MVSYLMAILAEQLFYLFCEAALLLVAVLCNRLSHILDGLLLLVVKLGRNFQVYLYIKVSLGLAFKLLDALFAETEGGSRLSSRRYLI